LDGVTALSRVDVIMAYENMDGALVDAAVAAGTKGVVIAGVGNGNMTEATLNTLAKTGEAASRACALRAPRPAASAATSRSTTTSSDSWPP
jgi:L-asparaginase